MDGHDGKAMDVFVILMILMDLLSMVMCATRFDPLHADGRGQHMEAAKMITGCHFTRAGKAMVPSPKLDFPIISNTMNHH